jgi:hypothetical protein
MLITESGIVNHIFIWDTPSWITVAFDNNVHIVVGLVIWTSPAEINIL